MRAITTLLILREHVIDPLLASVKIPVHPRMPTTLTIIDQHYEHLRLDMQPLFQELGIAA